MITRHHIALALGSMLILYFPLVSTNVWALPAIALGVCTGAVLPDIQMKKPKTFRALSLAWMVTCVFKMTVLKVYLFLYRRIPGFTPRSEDKRLTHSLPGLCLLSGIFGFIIILLTLLFPQVAGIYYVKVFLAGIILGVLFHFTEDICTKKGLCFLYPFDERYRISGSIRPCNKEDCRIRRFHMLLCTGAAVVILINSGSMFPPSLKWTAGVAALGVCMALMIWFSDVAIDGPSDVHEPVT
ncbi:MAG: metal-dependent hydrolase [Methanoregula sp.]